MSENFFSKNRVTQSDYRGGATNQPRKHPLYLDSNLPKIKFKTQKGRTVFFTQLESYVSHFIQVLLGPDNNQKLIEKMVHMIKTRLMGSSYDE